MEVINPNGQSSGQFNFTVQAPPTAPSITSVSPVSPVGTNSAQPFTINGANFVAGCNVTLRTGLSTYANRTQSSFSTAAITINPNFTTAAATWTVEVINPNGQSSGQFNFTVQAPSMLPDIRIEPVQLVFDFVPAASLLAGSAAIIEPNALLRPEVILPDAVNQWQAAVARGEVENPDLRKTATVAPRSNPPEKISAALNLTSCDIFKFEDTARILVTPGYTDPQRDQLLFNAANALLAQHGDNFDFVGFWINFVPDHQYGGAFYQPIENNVTGTGYPTYPTFNYRPTYGIAGQNIEGFVMMWNVNNWTPGDTYTRLVMGQEFEHRFGMYLQPLLDGRILQGDDADCGRSSHWSFKIDGQGSGMEIAEWAGSFPATRSGGALNFNSDIAGGLFSYVDLYLMGYVSAAEMDAGMSQLRYMDNGCNSPYSGPISTFNSANIIASNGARNPSSSTAQKNFRTGWIMIHQPGSQPTSSEITKALQIQEQMTTDWAASTLGRGQMDNSICPEANSFRIYNDGMGILSVTSISLETSGPWISWSPQAPFDIPVGGSQLIRVSVDFSQAPSGQSTRRLRVFSNDSDESPYPGAVDIVVNSPVPAISVTPVSRSFGSVEVGATEDRSFTVQNTGGGTLTGNASVSSPFAVISGSPYSLTANQSTSVTVRYSPTTAGSDNRDVSFTGGGGAIRSVFGSAYLPTVATPTVSPNGGNFLDSVLVTLDCSTFGATIRYTTDGNDPTGSSTTYSAPFTLTSSTPVKGKAFRSGYNDSTIASASFTVTPSPRPLLHYVRQGESLVFSWSTAAVGFTLEYTTALPATSWTTNPTLPTSSGGQYVVTNTITGGNKFYRLRK